MTVESPVYLSTVWDKLSPLVDNQTRSIMARNFETAEDLGMVFKLNGKQLSARDFYHAYADGHFFDVKPDALKLLKALSWGPGGAMVPFLFHSACQNYAHLTFAILQVLLGLEESQRDSVPTMTERQCIYCLGRDGEFGTEEHVVPEAFGLDELVLCDAVCQSCNNRLSQLDQFLAEFDPLALLRVYYVPLTKKGKFPRADNRDFVAEKVKPREIRFRSKSGKRVFSEQRLDDGSLKLSMSATSKRPVDAMRLARSIFKIALGVVAYDAGQEFACSDRFTAARSFIWGRGVMPNHLLLFRKARPDGPISTLWDPQFPTVVLIELLGMKFAVNLEPFPFTLPPEAPADAAVAFWLGENTRKGIVEPCALGCTH